MPKLPGHRSASNNHALAAGLDETLDGPASRPRWATSTLAARCPHRPGVRCPGALVLLGTLSGLPYGLLHCCHPRLEGQKQQVEPTAEPSGSRLLLGLVLELHSVVAFLEAPRGFSILNLALTFCFSLWQGLTNWQLLATSAASPSKSRVVTPWLPHAYNSHHIYGYTPLGLFFVTVQPQIDGRDEASRLPTVLSHRRPASRGRCPFGNMEKGTCLPSEGGAVASSFTPVSCIWGMQVHGAAVEAVPAAA